MLDYKILDEMIDTTVPIEYKLAHFDITKKDALARAAEYIKQAHRTAEKLGIRGDHKLFFFRDMCSKVDLCDEEQLKLFCSVVADSGLLFGKKTDEEQKLTLWLSDSARSERFFQLTTERRASHRRVKEISTCTQATKAGNSRRSAEVYQLLMENNYAAECADPAILRDNLEDVEWLINNYVDFDLIAPFVYFQVLTRNGKKMLEKRGYSLTVENLFNYHGFTIGNDNGKNYDKYTDHCQLYVDLLDIFPEADKQLCHACFLSTSNLARWVFCNIEPMDELPLYLDDIFSTTLFSCFDEGLNEFEFFSQNTVDFGEVMDYLFKDRRTVADVMKFVDSFDEATFDEFVLDPEPIVNGMLSGLKFEPQNEQTIKAICYYKICQRIDDMCHERIRDLITDAPANGGAI